MGIPFSGRPGRCCYLAAVRPLNKRSLSTYCVPESVLGTGEAAGNRMRPRPWPHGAGELEGGWSRLFQTPEMISDSVLEATQGFAWGLAHSRWLILFFCLFLTNGDYQTPGERGPAMCVGGGSAAILGLEVAATMRPGSGRCRVPREGPLPSRDDPDHTAPATARRKARGPHAMLDLCRRRPRPSSKVGAQPGDVAGAPRLPPGATRPRRGVVRDEARARRRQPELPRTRVPLPGS